MHRTALPALPARGQCTVTPIAPCPTGTESQGGPSPDHRSYAGEQDACFQYGRRCSSVRNAQAAEDGALVQTASRQASGSISALEQLVTMLHEQYRGVI